MKKTFFSLAVAALAAFHLNAGEINVFAAANVTYAFDELKAEFAKSNPDTNVTVTLGASGALSTQVKKRRSCRRFHGCEYEIRRGSIRH